MKYAYKDLGDQPQGSTAIVDWRGSAATVMLLDPVGFQKYVERMPFSYRAGGHYRCSPARLPIPEDGRWYAVVDLGRHSSGRPPTVEIRTPANAH